MFSFICIWINDWVNNREAGDLRRYRAHYDVMVMQQLAAWLNQKYNDDLLLFRHQEIYFIEIEFKVHICRDN